MKDFKDSTNEIIDAQNLELTQLWIELKEQQRQSKKIIESLPVGYGEIRNGHIRRVNKKLTEIILSSKLIS